MLGKAEPLALAADPEGGLAVAGAFDGALRVGQATASSRGVFVLRTEANGSVRWLHSMPADGASAVSFFANGDAAVVGRAGDHCFAARLAAADGREVWTASLPGEGESSCRALSIDARGEVWATGYFSGFLGGFRSNGMYDFFVVKFAGDSGTATLVRAIGGKGKELPRAIVALPSGGAVVAGQFGGEVDVSESDVDFGKGPVRSAGDYDGFVLMLAADGKTSWVATFGDNGDDEVNALLVADYGAIFASGHHQPAGNYRGLNPHAVGNFEGIVLRYSMDGRGEWVRIFDGPSSVANYLAFDPQGRVWTAGVEHGLRVGSVQVDDAGHGDAYALAFDPRNGEPLGYRRFGGPAFEIARGLARLPDGLALTGFTEGEVQICGKPVGTFGEQTAFVVWLRDL